MSASQQSLFSDQALLQFLKHMFQQPVESIPASNDQTDAPKPVEQETEKVDERVEEPSGNANAEPKPALQEAAASSSEEPELAQAEAKEITPQDDEKVKIDHFITQEETSDTDKNSLNYVSRDELASVLQTFVNLVRENRETNGTEFNDQLNFSPPARVVHSALEAQNAEIDQLKSLLVEAQSTIITLLTDRVDDRARIATLESETRLLPDFSKGQKTGVGDHQIESDLTKLKADLEKLKATSRANERAKIRPPLPTWRRWLIKILSQ